MNKAGQALKNAFRALLALLASSNLQNAGLWNFCRRQLHRTPVDASYHCFLPSIVFLVQLGG